MSDGGCHGDGNRCAGAGFAIDGCGSVGDQAEPVGGRRPQHADVGTVDRIGGSATTNNRGDSAVISDIDRYVNNPGSAVRAGGQHIGSGSMLLRDNGQVGWFNGKTHIPTVTARCASLPFGFAVTAR